MSETVRAVAGVFDRPEALMRAVAEVRARSEGPGGRLGKLEAYTPYPIHGIEEALGLKKSPLPGMVFVMGLLGTVVAFAFQYWMNGVDYPIVTGGKPVTAWQAFVPIMFEVTVLFATFTAGLGMLLLLNRLPCYGHPVTDSALSREITRDRFVLAVERDDDGTLDAGAAVEALRAAGAVRIECLPEPPLRGPAISLEGGLALAAGGVGLVLAAAAVTYVGVKVFPLLPPMVHMQRQPRLEAQAGEPFFADRQGIRPAVSGTVARGRLPVTARNDQEAALLANPLPRTEAILVAGRAGYGERCIVCHGALGDGKPLLTSAYGAQPANLHQQRLRDAPDGSIYRTIVAGRNSMPPFAREVPDDRRWAIVHYVRALQRAQNAEERDLR